MTDYSNLIARLRGEQLDCHCAAYSRSECCCDTHWPEEYCAQAADALEELTKPEDDLIDEIDAAMEATK